MPVPTPRYSTGYHNRISTSLERHGYRLDGPYLADVAGPPAKTRKVNEAVFSAVRISDGYPVIVKAVGTQHRELTALRMLSSEPLVSDPRNRCIRIIDSFPQDEGGEWTSFVVSPVYRSWYDPPMHLVAETIPFIYQLLEGLAFLHDQNIAHGDIKSINVLMDIPDSCKPTPSIRLESRTQYLYIDFGSCTIFNNFEARRKVQVFGGTFDLPESPSECWPPNYVDVFKADIWLLGHMLRNTLSTSNTRIPFIDPLIRRMHSQDPELRPTAQECLDLFQGIVSKMCWSLTTRLPNPYLTTYYGVDESKWPSRRAEDAKEYIQRLVHFLVLTNGSPRIVL